MSDTHGDTDIRRLRAMLDAHARRHARRAGWTRRFVPTGLPALDAILPHGGLPRGAVVEIIAPEPGAGATAVAMRIAAASAIPPQATNHVRPAMGPTPATPNTAPSIACPPATVTADTAPGMTRRPSATATDTAPGMTRPPSTATGDTQTGTVVLIDAHGDFYPPAARQHGITLRCLVVVRSRNEADAVWATVQSLACPAVASVIAPLRLSDEHLSRRLQLAAERSGGIGLILTTARRPPKSFAAVRMRIDGVSEAGASEAGVSEAGVSERGVSERGVSETGMSKGGVPEPHTVFEKEVIPTNHMIPTNEVVKTGHASRIGGPHGYRAPDASTAARCRITLLKVREGTPAGPVLVNLADEPDTRPLHPRARRRAVARAG